jgi:nitroimidazol reductase NimA-like FMN-containing flavoprotein (pyridoxamine 5'-phosphate oxidase superfamily)
VAQQMTNEGYRSFMLDLARTAVLATVRADGRPHAAPIWFDLDDKALAFTTGESTVKGRNMRRDPRVSLCIADRADEYGRRDAVEGELLVRVTPRKIVAYKNISD